MGLTINCPECGERMKLVRSGQPDMEIFRCAVHGPFHFGRNTDVTPGLPREFAEREAQGRCLRLVAHLPLVARPVATSPDSNPTRSERTRNS
jgi:hypothetical protein